MERRVTARENIERHLCHLGIAEFVEITDEGADRVFGWPDPRLRKFIALHHWPRDMKLAAEHFHGEHCEAFREPWGKYPAMQICFHPCAAGDYPEFVEIDMDEAAPVDLVGALKHLWEVLTPEPTDQQKIARMLDMRWGKGSQ